MTENREPNSISRYMVHLVLGWFGWSDELGDGGLEMEVYGRLRQ